MKIGKRYFMDSQNDITGIYVGDDERGNYLFASMNNNYCYLLNEKGQVPMPSKGYYVQTDDLVVFL